MVKRTLNVRLNRLFNRCIPIDRLQNAYMKVYGWLPHSNEGEENRQHRIHPLVILLPVISTGSLYLGSTYVIQFLLSLKAPVVRVLRKKETIKVFFNQDLHFFNVHYFGLHYPEGFLFWIVLGFSLFFGYKMFKKAQARFGLLNTGQKGDSRLATVPEIWRQYRWIPDAKETFKGIGGIPVSHFLGFYAIDRDTVNSLVIGASRSGKGQLLVYPMIDILSRAQEQSAMVVNDPKGELFSGTKEMLEKRGYEVLALNLLDPLQGMSYNPLTLIVEAWKKRDFILAQKLTKAFSHMLFFNPNESTNKWVYDGAEKMMNGVILALIDECDQRNELDKVTLYNVGQMITELGTNKVLVNKVEKTYLDLYFQCRPQGDVAKGQYSSVNLNSEKAKSNIISTVDNVCSNFKMDNIAMMTSKNSFPLKDIGFPKYIEISGDETLRNRKMMYRFERLVVQDHKRRVTTLYQDTIHFSLEGVGSANFDCHLQDGDLLYIEERQNDHPKGTLEKQNIYRLTQNEEDQKKKQFSLELISKRSTRVDSIDLFQHIHLHYADKPVAVFMITPDYDTSDNSIASTFIDQLYITLSREASLTRGKKCHRRVHFILDEFGNMPPLSEFDNKLTVCLGRNILFNLFIQSYAQIDSLYGKEVAETVKENCQNHVLIKTNNRETIQEFSKKVGHHTVETASYDRQTLKLETHHHVSISDEAVLTEERIADLWEEETIVTRSLHRQDLNRQRIRPYPIFNTKKTRMPYTYKFLDEIDGQADINDFDLHSEHMDLDLKDTMIDFKTYMAWVIQEMSVGATKESSEETKKKYDTSQVPDFNAESKAESKTESEAKSMAPEDRLHQLIQTLLAQEADEAKREEYGQTLQLFEDMWVTETAKAKEEGRNLQSSDWKDCEPLQELFAMADDINIPDQYQQSLRDFFYSSK